MAINTTNYNLVKPAQTDAYNVDVFNSNADIIDATMKLNERTYERIKLDVSTQKANSIAVWKTLSSSDKYSQGYLLSDKSLCVQYFGAQGSRVLSALMTFYIKSNSVDDVSFYVADVDDDIFVYDSHNDNDTLITSITSKNLVTIPAFTGVKKIYALINNTSGDIISANFGGLTNAELCDESEYTG